MKFLFVQTLTTELGSKDGERGIAVNKGIEGRLKSDSLSISRLMPPPLSGEVKRFPLVARLLKFPTASSPFPYAKSPVAIANESSRPYVCSRVYYTPKESSLPKKGFVIMLSKLSRVAMAPFSAQCCPSKS